MLDLTGGPDDSLDITGFSDEGDASLIADTKFQEETPDFDPAGLATKQDMERGTGKVIGCVQQYTTVMNQRVGKLRDQTLEAIVPLQESADSIRSELRSLKGDLGKIVEPTGEGADMRRIEILSSFDQLRARITSSEEEIHQSISYLREHISALGNKILEIRTEQAAFLSEVRTILFGGRRSVLPEEWRSSFVSPNPSPSPTTSPSLSPFPSPGPDNSGASASGSSHGTAPNSNYPSPPYGSRSPLCHQANNTGRATTGAQLHTPPGVITPAVPLITSTHLPPLSSKEGPVTPTPEEKLLITPATATVPYLSNTIFALPLPAGSISADINIDSHIEGNSQNGCNNGTRARYDEPSHNMKATAGIRHTHGDSPPISIAKQAQMSKDWNATKEMTRKENIVRKVARDTEKR